MMKGIAPLDVPGGLAVITAKPPAHIEWLGTPEPKGLGVAKPSVKQHLAALRMLFDWLVVGHVVDVNLAHAVPGPKHVVKKGRNAGADFGRSTGAARRRRYQFAHGVCAIAP